METTHLRLAVNIKLSATYSRQVSRTIQILMRLIKQVQLEGNMPALTVVRDWG